MLGVPGMLLGRLCMPGMAGKWWGPMPCMPWGEWMGGGSRGCGSPPPLAMKFRACRASWEIGEVMGLLLFVSGSAVSPAPGGGVFRW